MPANDRYLKVANAPFEKPVLIYDGECTFCQMSVLRIAAWTGRTVEFVQSQSVRERFPEIPEQNFDAAVQFVERDGTVSSGGAAVLRSLACVPYSGSWPLWLYRTIPGFSVVLEFFYRIVANNRKLISQAVLKLVGSDVRPARYSIASDFFPRLLGLVYLCAFLSLWVQWDGLYGPNGVLPMQGYLKMLTEQFPVSSFKDQIVQEKYRIALTVFWWDSSPAFVNGIFVVAVISALLAMAGVLPLPSLAFCWGAYLSMVSVGQDFMNMQWDYLLLETGFVAIFCVPWTLRFTRDRSAEPTARGRWALWFLLFKLMLMSGVVKWFGGDTTWRDGTALEYHFFTQPLPTWTSWFAYHLPGGILKLFCYGTLFIELIVPFFIFCPRRVQRLAFLLFVLLQGMIALTGNYGFFNLLTLALCVVLLDDSAFPRAVRKLFAIKDPPLQPPVEKAGCAQGCALPNVRIPRVESVWDVRPTARRWPNAIAGPVLLFVLVLSGTLMLVRFEMMAASNRFAMVFLEGVDPLRSINSYGLFQVMTTSRDEIVIEGSDDGKTWLAYEMKYKPGDPARRPVFVGPHMPRLDWHMWFAALGSEERHPWFRQVLRRIFQGSPDVLAFFVHNPFPEKPPKMLRARLYRYEFTKPGGAGWWVRSDRGLYFPEVRK